VHSKAPHSDTVLAVRSRVTCQILAEELVRGSDLYVRCQRQVRQPIRCRHRCRRDSLLALKHQNFIDRELRYDWQVLCKLSVTLVCPKCGIEWTRISALQPTHALSRGRTSKSHILSSLSIASY
jgi:hypothetical protein